MKNSKEMRKLQKTSYKEDWTWEVEVELQETMGVHSISTAFESGKDDGKLYTNNLLEKVLDSENLRLAFRKVKSNKGSHGVDGMKVDELPQYLKQNIISLKKSILEGTYRPQPVRRVEIPKPDGGIRLLGIPTVVDRMIQQAVAQVLTPIFEKTFSPYFIYNDNQLRDLISKMPRNKEELLNVAGFGEVKANKYGDDILKIIKKY